MFKRAAPPGQDAKSPSALSPYEDVAARASQWWTDEGLYMCSGAQSKCGGRAIEGGFRRRFAETEGALWRTLFETERTLFETDARSKISTHDN